LTSGQPYNPAGWFFSGPAYTLTAPDGSRFELDGQGEATAIQLPGAGRVLVTDSGLLGPDGAVLMSLVRDAAGRITALAPANGAAIHYEYDTAGHLASVQAGGNEATSVYSYRTDGRLAVASAAVGAEAVSYAPT